MHDDDQMDAGDRKLLDDVENVGWHMVGVPDDDVGPGFVYSIGLFHSFRHPEVIVIGMDQGLMFAVVHEVASRAKAGNSVAAEDVRDGLLEGFACTFRPVGRRWYRDYLGYAIWFYRSLDFPVLQCVWPDKQRRWPWDPDFNPHWKPNQPLLD